MWDKIFRPKKGEQKDEGAPDDAAAGVTGDAPVDTAPPSEPKPASGPQAPVKVPMPEPASAPETPMQLDDKDEEEQISLKAKVSTWESFFSLFSSDKNEFSLYIPTEKQTRVREHIAIMLFTPMGDSMPLDGQVVHIFYDSSGKQIGVGVKLGEPGAKNARFRELVDEAARRVEVPQGVLDPDGDEGIPIFVEDDSAVEPRKMGGPRTTDELQPVQGPDDDEENRGQPTGLFNRYPTGPGNPAVGGMDEPLLGGFTVPDPAPRQRQESETLTGLGPDEQDTGAPQPVASDGLLHNDTVPGLRQADTGAFAASEPQTGRMPVTEGALPLASPPPRQPAAKLADSVPTLSSERSGAEAAPGGGVVPIVGMDFGTTRSSVAVVLDGEVKVLQAPSGLYNVPSVVGFTAVGEAVVGTEARELLIIDPAHAIASPKRLLGRSYQDPEMEPFLAGLAINHSEGPNGEVLLHPRGKTYTVPQVCAPILFTLRLMAQEFLQQEVRQVVLTSPVSFDEERLAALEEAASLAGLELVDTVDEPTAAALAHHYDPEFKDMVAVFDFGGGTFDFSLVDVSSEDMAVVASAGDTWLGGDDFDLALANAAANAFWRRHQIEVRHQVVRWQRLLIAAEKAKRELSVKDETILALPDAALTAKGPLALRCPVSRQQFNLLVEELVERSLDTCREAMDLAEVHPANVNAVFLSGGTSLIPTIRDALGAFFGKPPKTSISPERAVVLGAALVAAQVYESRVVEEG